MTRIIEQIISGSPIKDIICKIATGGGKSTIPIIAGRLIKAGLADAICWICPRTSLQNQAECNFIDRFFRKLLNHNLIIRASTNDINPCRGTNGFVTTYQAIGLDRYQTVLNDFQHKRYILVLDEYHHAEEEDGSWTKALMPLYEQAKYRVLMTGTLSRGDGKKIAFTPYCLGESGIVPSLEGDETTAVIEYSRRDALAEKAILPLEFIFAEGRAQWEKKSGRVMDVKLSTVRDQTARHALYTALHTEYATELLTLAVNHWQAHRREKNRLAKLLVVSAGIKSAKQYTGLLKSMGLKVDIATSDDSPACHKAIKAYKNNKLDALVSVNVCYEGLDVPAISHICCLTNIRSRQWIEQMAGRAVRIDPNGGPYEQQKGYIFAPKDEMFVEIKEQIEAEQTPFLKVVSNGEGKKTGNKLVLEMQEQGPPGGITPLSSTLIGAQVDPLFPNFVEEKTSSEIEAEIRAQIESHIRTFSFQNRHNPKKINAEVYAFFAGKKRENMTIPELENCLSYIKTAYPLNFIRGTGRPRVSTKAVPINVTWKVA
jgi:superfamily II DNA or RNA helicase